MLIDKVQIRLGKARSRLIDETPAVRLVIAVFVLSAFIAIAPSGANAITTNGWGIADNVRDRPGIDSVGNGLNQKIDTRMERLNPSVYRVQVPYDIAVKIKDSVWTGAPTQSPAYKLAVLKNEITLARQRGATSVLVTFCMGFDDTFPRKKWTADGSEGPYPYIPNAANSTSSYYAYAVKEVIKQLDPLGVDAWSPANEPNAGWRWMRDVHDPEFGPARLAQFFKVLKDLKPAGDKIVSPEFHDKVNSVGIPELVTSAGLKPGEDPAIANWSAVRHFIHHYLNSVSALGAGSGWGDAAAFHPYGGVSEVRPESLNDFEALVPAGTDIWLTEIGARPTYLDNNGDPIRCDIDPNGNPSVCEVGTQTARTRFLINYLKDPAASHQHFKRAYYYNPWDDGTPWDSALLNNDGSPRPAYTLWAEQSRASATIAANAAAPVISPRQSFAGDFDGNGRGDIGLRDVDTGDVKVRLGTSWAETPEVRFNWAVGGHYQIFGGKFNGDNISDIALRNSATGNIFFRYGPTFAASGETAMAWATGLHYQPFSGDFNNDGKGDVGLRDPYNGGMYFRAGPGFTSETSFGWAPDSAGQVYKPFAGDFNNDGKTDIGVFNQANGWFSYKAGPGPYFGAQTNFQWAYGTNYTPFVADWNGDGKADVGLRDSNNGTWYFRTAPNLGTGPETTYDWTKG